MSPTLTPEGDDTVHGGTAAPTSCPSCGSPRRVGRHGWTCVCCSLGTALNELAAEAEGKEPPGEEPVTAGPGRFFDHYELARDETGGPWELGRGAMGITYKALDLNLRCPVALKVIHQRLLHEPSVRERFKREARAAANLKHPNVAAVHHLGMRGDEWFFAMEFIEGETLDAIVRRRGPLEPALALAVGKQVARALGAAERVGVVHRDIKPANLMLVNDPGTGIGTGPWLVKVIDFGVAKSAAHAAAAGAGADLTGGLMVGTPSFASPEQLRGDPTDFRSDAYSLGVTLWWTLLGRTPFAGDSFTVVGQHLTKAPPFGELTAAGVPASVVTLLRGMLEKDPADRPQTAAELLAGLAGAAAALPAVEGAPDGPMRRIRRRSSAGRPGGLSTASAWRWASVAAGLALAVGGTWLASRRDSPTGRAVTPTVTTLVASTDATARPNDAAATIRSLAVLPFRRSTTAGGVDSTEALLADGLAEDITARLSKLDGLKVISQASSAVFRDTELLPGDIANRLGVRGLLLGKVRQRPDGQFTIRAELVDAPDGGRVVWSETYDRLRPDDLALVQGRISEDIAAGLRLVLTPAKEAALAKPSTENALAYDRYLRGRAFYKRYTPVDLERAAGFFQQAMELDPDFAAAHAALAETLGQQFGNDGDPQKLEQALTIARESVRLNPNTPETHRALGVIHYYQGQHLECLQSCQRALDLDPNHVASLTLAGGAWRNLGRLDKAMHHLRRASVRNPLDARGQVVLGETLTLLADVAGAEKALRRALELQVDHGSARCALANLRLLEGDTAAAREELRLARTHRGESFYVLYLDATVELFAGQDAAAEAAYRRLLSGGVDRGLDYYEAVSARSALGWLRARAGDAVEAGRFLGEAAAANEAAVRRSPDQARVLYDLAAVRAVQRRDEEAIICLQQADAAGWCHYRATRRDPRFAALAADGRFLALMQAWQNRVEEMRRAGESSFKEELR